MDCRESGDQAVCAFYHGVADTRACDACFGHRRLGALYRARIIWVYGWQSSHAAATADCRGIWAARVCPDILRSKSDVFVGNRRWTRCDGLCLRAQ